MCSITFRKFALLFCLLLPASLLAVTCPAGPPCGDLNTQFKGARLPSWGVDSGTANAYAITTTGGIGSGEVLQTGDRFMFIATHANTSASTLAINGGSAIAIKKNVSSALASGDIPLNGVVEVTYDGTNLQLMGNGVFSGSVSCSQLPAFTGDTTTSAGSCATTTVKVNGVSYPASPSTHAVPVITASNTATYKVIPDCQDTGGNHLNFTQSGDSITCGTSGGGGGGGGAGTCSSVGQIGTPAASSGFSGTSITMSFSCTASTVVIGVTSTTAATDPLTVTGTGAACPASWTLAKSSTSHANVGWLYYGKTAGSGSCVISTNVSCSGWCFEVGAEFANMNPTVDKALADYSSGTSSITTTLPALTNTNDIVVSLLGGFHAGWTALPTAPLTSLVASNASNLAWYQASSASAQSFNWGITCCGSLWWDDNVILNAAFTTSAGSAVFSQTIEQAGIAKPQEQILNFDSQMTCADNPSNFSTDCHPSITTVNGVSYPASPSTNTVPVVTASNTITYETAPVAAGGTGAATLAAHGVVLGNTTSPVAVTSAGTTGQCLTSNGASSDPSFQTCGSGGLQPNFFGLWAFTAPLSSGWSWDNQGSSTVDSTNGYEYASFLRQGSTQMQARYRTAPSTPYTITAAFLYDITGVPPGASGNGTAAGLLFGFRDSAGKYVSIDLNMDGSGFVGLDMDNWTSATSFSSHPSTFQGDIPSLANLMREPLLLQISDDGANLTFRWSIDGNHWKQLSQLSRTAFFASGPNAVFYGAYAEKDTVEVAVIHWQ